MNRIIVVEPSKCTGCRLCEVVCSAAKHGAVNPTRARITVVKWESICLETPMLCQQCEAAPCMAICPVKALTLDEVLSRVNIDYDKCIGCRFCVAVCPFGAMGIDPADKKVIKCDLCDGEPKCVAFCETKALQYVDASLVNRTKMRLAAERLSSLVERYAA
jgi:carbon-monoxide dehydrogenase iron sulfur subunit